jgi:hypothetical protein
MEKKTVVLVTYGAAREHAHGECMDRLKHEQGLLVLETRGHSHIDMARSLLATTALAHGADVVFFIDHDMLFEPDDVGQLAELARETRGVVGSVYSQRRMGGSLVGSFSPKTTEAVFYKGGGLYESTGAIGMGFTAIHRDVFERLDQSAEYAEVNSQDGLIRPYFKKLVVAGYWFQEDGSFCHAARQAGATTHVDTRFRVKHQGTHWFQIEDTRRKITEEPTLTLGLRPT